MLESGLSVGRSDERSWREVAVFIPGKMEVSETHGLSSFFAASPESCRQTNAKLDRIADILSWLSCIRLWKLEWTANRLSRMLKAWWSNGL